MQARAARAQIQYHGILLSNDTRFGQNRGTSFRSGLSLESPFFPINKYIAGSPFILFLLDRYQELNFQWILGLGA